MSIINIIFNSSEDDEIEKNQPKRKYWVRPYYLDRESSGAFNCTFNKLRQYPKLFYNYTSMNLAEFDELLLMVGPLIEKQTVIREPLCSTLRLAVTLRYLATGESQTSLGLAYKCSVTSIHRMVCETTKAITSVLKGKVFPDLSEEYFETVALGFETRWNFPNCIGAIAGKHVTIQAPGNSGSEFYNYKKTSSIVLMAICDHDYNFIMCNIGAAGRQSDGGIFRESGFGKRFYSKTLPIPEPTNITDKFKNVPYVIVADDAFVLDENMLKPYTSIQTTKQRIFNYRLSRARCMIENCFSILSAKWRIFRTTIISDVSLAEDIIQSCVCLHNWLRQKNDGYITPELIDREVQGVLVPGSWNSQTWNFLPLQSMNTNSTNLAKSIRNKFADYFYEEGQVEWQINQI